MSEAKEEEIKEEKTEEIGFLAVDRASAMIVILPRDSDPFEEMYHIKKFVKEKGMVEDPTVLKFQELEKEKSKGIYDLDMIISFLQMIKKIAPKKKYANREVEIHGGNREPLIISFKDESKNITVKFYLAPRIYNP